VPLEGLRQLKNHFIGIQSRDLPACSTVPQSTTLPRDPSKIVGTLILYYFVVVNLFYAERKLYISKFSFYMSPIFREKKQAKQETNKKQAQGETNRTTWLYNLEGLLVDKHYV
jgi:hypothetical protein